MNLLAPRTPDKQTALVSLAAQEDWTVFEPKASEPDDQLFVASLSSFEAHMRASSAMHASGSGKAFILDCGFVESVLPNALANKHGDVHVIAIHTGLPMVMLEFAWFALAQASVLPEIGNSSAETSPLAASRTPPGLAVFLQTVQSGGISNSDLIPPIMPVDPHRSAAAYYLTLMMMRFVWLHELAHGRLGHIDYLRHLKGDGSNQLVVNELHMSELALNIPGVDSRMLQCLEFEADSWALSKSLALQQVGGENIDGISALPVSLRLRLALLAAYSTSWLMETITSTLTRGRFAITHPAPITRLAMLRQTVSWTSEILNTDLTALDQAAMAEFECVVRQIGMQWLQTDRFEAATYRAVFEETRAQLEPFRYVER